MLSLDTLSRIVNGKLHKRIVNGNNYAKFVTNFYYYNTKQ
jgi:hypothetical protein